MDQIPAPVAYTCGFLHALLLCLRVLVPTGALTFLAIALR